MVNQPHAFKHRDVVRAVKAARAAGIDASQVTVDPAPVRSPWVRRRVATPPSGNDLDNWLEKKDARQA